jgi:hypothetical protein
MSGNGADHGTGATAVVMLTLIQTAKLNDVDPQAWLADVLARIADHKITDLAALLPWNWRRAIPVCTENLVRIELMMESRHACGDDRADFPGPQAAGGTRQVQEPT